MFSTSFNIYIQRIQENYDFIKKFAKRRNALCGIEVDDLTELPYQTLKHDIPDLFKEGKFEEAMQRVLSIKKPISLKKVKRAANNKKLCFLLWIKEQYEKIGSMEQKYLFSQPDPKLLQAGIRELDVLEDINLIDNLAQGDLLKWDKIRKMPYSYIFNKQLKNTIEGRINKRLVELNKHG